MTSPFINLADIPLRDSVTFPVISKFDRAKPEAGGIRYVGRPGNSLDYFDAEE